MDFVHTTAIYSDISDALNTPIILLALHDPDFYHLDTCFCPLDEATVLLYPPAFERDGLACIEKMFDRIIVAPEREARELFACNAHSADGKHVIIQRGCVETCQNLTDHGYIPIEVDTDEFLKSGGSVFCMKQMFWNRDVDSD